MLTSNDAISLAFQLLSSTVREMYSAGRRCVGATLKLQLRHRSYNTFSEQQLGFAKFGDFLRAAERAGSIQLAPTPGGDLEVWPPGVRIPQPQVQPTSMFANITQPFSPTSRPLWMGPASSGLVRVRQDLWNAFTSLSIAWVYDRTNDIAYRADRNASVAGDNSTPSGSSNLIQIPPGRDRAMNWMRSFASTQGPETSARLLAVLEGDSAPYQFRNAIATDVNLKKAWGRYHVQQVLAAIQAWADSNNVKPRDITIPFISGNRPYWGLRPQSAETAPPPIPPAPTLLTASAAPSILTPRLLSLIDDLVDELLRLRGTLQIVEPKR